MLLIDGKNVLSLREIVLKNDLNICPSYNPSETFKAFVMKTYGNKWYPLGKFSQRNPLDLILKGLTLIMYSPSPWVNKRNKVRAWF